MAPVTIASLWKPLALLAVLVGLCAWVVALAGVSASINEQAYLSDGAQRWEWFLLSFELLALLLSAVAILRNRAPAHGAAHPHPHLRASCLALLAVITAISMTETNAKNAEIDTLRTYYASGARYYGYGNTRVTLAQLRAVRSYYAGILIWSACNALIILLLGLLPSTAAAVSVTVSNASKNADHAHAVAAPVAAKDVEAGALAPEAETVVVA